MKMGRPPNWETAEQLETQIEGFWDWIKDNEWIPDIEALAVYLETTRKTLLDYEKKKDFSYTIKRVKEKIFNEKKQLAFKGKMNPAVFIFDAKNNHDYKDKQEIGLDDTIKGVSINIKR